MVDRGWLERTGVNGYTVTDRGADALTTLGLDGAEWQRRSKASTRIVCGCLDWAERRDQLAGALAGALLQLGLAQGWFGQRPAERRALRVTPVGRQALAAWLPPDMLVEAG